ncbi:MAG: hypothetical protein HY013_06795 [Candidatus Solibacter usitatus]|nr:hypothetical protein [Candidatus Solibacter usitatus]
MTRLCPLVLGLWCLGVLSGAAPRSCVPGSTALGTFQLQVRGPAGEALPAARINILRQGYKVSYKPVQLPADIRREARVALVLAPAEGEITGTSPLTILDLQPAANPAEWTIPHRVSVLMLVFGPAGLDEKKITNVVMRDEDLISQVAGYADQTEQLESTIQTLVAFDETPEAAGELEARLGNSPVEQALLALLRAQNPALSTFNPLAVGRRAPPATLMGKAADGFFDNAGAVVPGGGILPGVKGFLMPETELRSVFAQHGDGGALMLCGKRRQPRSRTKVAYLWAHRVLDRAAPAVALPAETHVPAGVKSLIPIKPRAVSDWDILDHVRDWALAPVAGGAASPASVAVSPLARTLELDLRKSRIAPGAYKLTGKWDWDAVEAGGSLEIRPPGGLKTAKLAPSSQDRLIENSGWVPVKLEGPDFEFLEKITLQGGGEGRAKPVELDFTLPVGKRAGPQDTVYFELDTRGLAAGEYKLALLQAGGSSAEIPLRILPPHPKLEGLPRRVHLGERDQSVAIEGTGLGRIQRIECDRADVQLQEGGKRAVVRLREGLKPGDLLAFLLKVEGVEAAIRVEQALLVTPPRPRVRTGTAALPEELGVALREGEIPAGSYTGFALHLEHPGDAQHVDLACQGRPRSLSLRLGERLAGGQLERIGTDGWFLSFDAGAVGPSGCAVFGAIVSDSAGVSERFALGRVVRLPHLESFNGTVLRGSSLEVIEKLGWDAQTAVAVAGLPASIAGEGPKQVLRLSLPAPPRPDAALQVWLWGEAEPRATRIALSEPPKPAEPPKP